MTSSSFDANIPVLTEVIPVATPAPAAAIAAVTAKESSAKQVHKQAHKQTPPATIPFQATVPARYFAPSDWEQMEANLRESVLADLMGRIDDLLEHRLRTSINEVMQITVERMAEDIHDSLRANLREVVARAVAQEIRRARSAEN